MGVLLHAILIQEICSSGITGTSSWFYCLIVPKTDVVACLQENQEVHSTYGCRVTSPTFSSQIRLTPVIEYLQGMWEIYTLGQGTSEPLLQRLYCTKLSLTSFTIRNKADVAATFNCCGIHTLALKAIAGPDGISTGSHLVNDSGPKLLELLRPIPRRIQRIWFPSVYNSW